MVQVPVKTATLLIVTANASVSRHVQGVIRQEQYDAQQVTSVDAARGQLESYRPTLLLLDFALEASADLCAEASRIGLSVLALIPDESLADVAFTAGARDYVTYGG